MGELAAVTRVDGRTIGSGDIGPITTRLADAFAALVQRDGEAVG